MGAVVEISRCRDREILDVLRHFVALAERGKLKGLALCAKSNDGKEDISIAGDYRSHPAQAVNVAMRMSWRLTQMQDDLE
jgi:hypothetical protein